MIATACSMEWLCGMSAIMKLSSEGRAAITQLSTSITLLTIGQGVRVGVDLVIGKSG